MVMIDYYSRFVEIREMKLTSARKTSETLDEVFRVHSFPEVIWTDNGQPYPSEEFTDYCKSKNIKLIHTIPYWPQMNGEVERQNRGILRTLRIAKIEKKDWRKALKDYAETYNSTPHTVTGKQPFEMLNGRAAKLLIPSLKDDVRFDEEVRDRDKIEKMKGKIYADKRRHAKDGDLEVGDVVMLRNYGIRKLDPTFNPDPFKIVVIHGPDLIVESVDGIRYRRHSSHAKRWPKEPEDSNGKIFTPTGTNQSPAPQAQGPSSTSEESKRQPSIAAERPQRPKRITGKPSRFDPGN